jgi:hypothetical protein
MLTVVLIAVFAYILSRLTVVGTGTGAEIDALIKETHKYSGIHEDSYSLFYANIRMAREYKSETFLRRAIEHLNEIPFYNPDVQEDIAELGQKIMIAFESIYI